MIRKISYVVPIILLVLSIPVCAQSEKQASENQVIVAKINDMPITVEDFNNEIDAYNSVFSHESYSPDLKIITRQQKIDYLKNEIVKKELLYQDALERGIDKQLEETKEIKQWINGYKYTRKWSDEEWANMSEEVKKSLLIQKLLQQEMDKVEANSKEIEDYYNIHKEQLIEPEKIHIREIIVPSEQEAKELLVQLLQGADFASLAKDHSISTSAKRGGDLGFMQKRLKDAVFDSVAFSEALEPGEISRIFELPEGYCILKLEAKLKEKQKSLSDLWEDIKRAVISVKQLKRVDEFTDQLYSKATVIIYEENIK